MQPLRFRLLLPVVFGCLAIALIAWEFHNESVIEAAGMGWDTGPPIWPCQTSWILLQAIDAPAYALDLPLSMLLGVKTNQARLLLEVPTILFLVVVYRLANRLRASSATTCVPAQTVGDPARRGLAGALVLRHLLGNATSKILV